MTQRNRTLVYGSLDWLHEVLDWRRVVWQEGEAAELEAVLPSGKHIWLPVRWTTRGDKPYFEFEAEPPPSFGIFDVRSR